jgi:hypothetical protein
VRREGRGGEGGREVVSQQRKKRKRRYDHTLPSLHPSLLLHIPICDAFFAARVYETDSGIGSSRTKPPWASRCRICASKKGIYNKVSGPSPLIERVQGRDWKKEAGRRASWGTTGATTGGWAARGVLGGLLVGVVLVLVLVLT